MDSAPENERSAPPDGTDYVQVQQGAEFGELRSAYRSFAFPLTVGFIVWYLLYVLLSNYAGGFMATKVVGNINIAVVFGLLQFLSTFLIAFFYARHADKALDPLATKLREEFESENRR